MSSPCGVAVDASGNVYIADSNNARALEVPLSGNPTPIGGAVFSLPVAVAVDSMHSVEYVGDANNNAVYMVTSSGTTKITISNVSNLIPQALVTDASGNLYIADGNSDNIYELPFQGTTAQNVTPSGFTLSSPSGLSFDAAGNFFVLDSFNSRIIEVPPGAGAALYQVPITGLNTASSLALDPSGNLYVTDTVPFSAQTASPCGSEKPVTTVLAKPGAIHAAAAVPVSVNGTLTSKELEGPRRLTAPTRYDHLILSTARAITD